MSHLDDVATRVPPALETEVSDEEVDEELDEEVPSPASSSSAPFSP
jgi:hypothetical protein